MSAQADPEAMLNDMLAMQQEPLHPELLPYVEEGRFGTMVRHPLIVEIMPINGWVNRRFVQTQEALAEAEAAEKWGTCVFLHARGYRTDALIDYAVGRDEWEVPRPLVECDQATRDLAADVWVDSENLGQVTEEWAAMFEGAEGLVLASEEERAEFEALPETLRLYRGDCEDGGWSWSLDPRVAKFFAVRFGADYPLVTGKVAKSAVFGYLTRRNESEVLVPEDAVYDVEPYVPE